MAENKICLICGNAARYSCPQCLTANCSVACFKSHKDNNKCERKQDVEVDFVDDRTQSRTNVFTTVDTVPPEKLKDLDKSETIRNLLKNSHLRNFLLEVNSSSNAWNAMKLAMMEPLFLEFADECIKIIEPQSN